MSQKNVAFHVSAQRADTSLNRYPSLADGFEYCALTFRKAEINVPYGTSEDRIFHSVRRCCPDRTMSRGTIFCSVWFAFSNITGVVLVEGAQIVQNFTRLSPIRRFSPGKSFFSGPPTIQNTNKEKLVAVSAKT